MTQSTVGRASTSGQTAAPVVRLPTGMRQRDDLEMVGMLPVHEKKREVAKRNAANCASGANATDHLADRGMGGDQIDRRFDLGPQPVAKAGALTLVPADVLSELLFRLGIGTDSGTHRPKMSRSIRARTSDQSEVARVPASTAAQRRSISAAHASSMSVCTSGSRLSRSRAAMSARSDSGRLSTCSRSAVVSLMMVNSTVTLGSLRQAPAPARAAAASPGAAARAARGG